MTPMPEQWPCSTCGETTDFDVLPVDDGFDPDERLCVRCGLALWVLTPLGVVRGGPGDGRPSGSPGPGRSAA